MNELFTKKKSNAAIKISAVTKADYKHWLTTQTHRVKNWLEATGFTVSQGKCAIIPSTIGEVEHIVVGMNDAADFWAIGAIPPVVKKGEFYLDKIDDWSQDQLERACIAWGLGSYKFAKYKSKKNAAINAKLFIPAELNFAYIKSVIDATFMVRDLINTPAEDLGPEEFATAAIQVADKFDAKIKQIVGDDLLKNNFPAVYAVGRGSMRASRIIELRWGNPKHPKITLVGKGVCFDSGGLDIKPSGSMLTMKKDMGGAANVLGLAALIMQTKLPLNLRVIMPLVENLVSATSYKPGDIIKTRKGITVEVKNTDAEGRLILADALALACEDKPDLLIDFATLTGARNIALGPDYAALFANDCETANNALCAISREGEYAWQLPLHKPYRKILNSNIADISNSGLVSAAGTITGALFLQEFIVPKTNWLHFDIFASNEKTLPGRPEGGEATCLRGVFNYIKEKYSAK